MTKNLNMQLPYARATVSISDVVVVRTWASCLYLENDIWHTAWVFRKILNKWPIVGVMLMQTHATCSWDRALAHLGETSNLEQIGCIVLLFTWPARASVNPPGTRLDPLIKLICNNVWKSAEPHSVMNYSKPDTERCANKDAGPQGGGLWDPTSVGEENEKFFIGMWKPLPNKHVLKP